MSMMRCERCSRAVDTDYDCDSLYVVDGQCVCEWCRTERDDAAIEKALHPAEREAGESGGVSDVLEDDDVRGLER
jgi:hypothetical protein